MSVESAAPASKGVRPTTSRILVAPLLLGQAAAGILLFLLRWGSQIR